MKKQDFGRRWKVKRLVLALILSWVGTEASAHEMWLEADPAPTAPAAKTEKTEARGLHLRLGEHLAPEEEKPFVESDISRFDLYAVGKERQDLLKAGKSGQVPVAKLPLESGPCLVVMDRTAHEVTVGAEKFNAYLTEAGLTDVLAQRQRAGQNEAEGKESYTRYLKALVPGIDPPGTLPNTFYKRRVGQRLEILLQNNPVRLPASRKLGVKVLFEGKPLAGAKVTLGRHTDGTAGTAGKDGATLLSAVTSAQGLAEFKLEQNGLWVASLVHLRAGPERKKNPNGAWEGFWGAYSFVAKGAGGTGGN